MPSPGYIGTLAQASSFLAFLDHTSALMLSWCLFVPALLNQSWWLIINHSGCTWYDSPRQDLLAWASLLPSYPSPTSNPPKPTRTPTVPYFSIIVAALRRPSHSFLISMRPQPAHTPKNTHAFLFAIFVLGQETA